MRTPATLYEQDLYAWAQEQAALLREGAWHALDLEHLITQRLLIAKRLRRNPSLRRTVPEEGVDAYDIARGEAAVALALDDALVPPQSPWTVAQVLDADFWPEEESKP